MRRVSLRNPNMLGFDVDRFDATGVLANGQTNSVVRVTTTSETFFPGVITFATDLFSPELRIGKVGVDLNGGDLEPGDRVHYDVTVHNGGRDAAINAVVSDQLPPFTSFVPGSLAIEGTPVTDGAGDDTGEVVGGVLTARVGEGASSTLGGTLLVQERARFSFDVVVTPDAPDGVSLSNVVESTYEGAQTGIELTSTSNRFEIPVVARSDLTVTKLVTGPAVYHCSGEHDIPVGRRQQRPQHRAGRDRHRHPPAGVHRHRGRVVARDAAQVPRARWARWPWAPQPPSRSPPRWRVEPGLQ